MYFFHSPCITLQVREEELNMLKHYSHWYDNLIPGFYCRIQVKLSRSMQWSLFYGSLNVFFHSPFITLQVREEELNMLKHYSHWYECLLSGPYSSNSTFSGWQNFHTLSGVSSSLVKSFRVGGSRYSKRHQNNEILTLARSRCF